jgi:hypothetical protein
VAALFLGAACFAQTAFEGTWKTDLSKSKFSPKPFTVYISQGWFHCVSCTPPLDIAADGQDHPVSGQPFDTASATIVDARNTTIVGKSAGKIVFEQTASAAADGKTLTLKTTMHPKDGSKAVTFEGIHTREGVLPAGVHATSGNWVMKKASGSAEVLLTTFKVNGEEITLTQPTGQTYTAKFDGADYPVKGDYGWDTVSLKRIDPHTIEETDKFKGSVIGLATSTVSANGKTMTVVATDMPSKRVSTYVATKQ